MKSRATAKSNPTDGQKIPIRIFLADRDPLFLHGIEDVLHDKAHGGAWKVTGKVGTVRELIHHPRLLESSVLLSGLFLRCGRFLSTVIPDLLVNQPDPGETEKRSDPDLSGDRSQKTLLDTQKRLAWE